MFTLIFSSLGLISVGEVSALENEPLPTMETVTPRAALCTCGGVFRPAGTNFTNWKRTGGRRNCADGLPWGEDLQESRTVFQEYQCERCGGGYDSQRTEYRWVCYGHR